MDIIENALKEGRSNLSEYESKLVLKSYGIPVTQEILIKDRNDLTEAMAHIAFPLVMKGCSPTLSHKTERNLVRLDIRNEAEAVSIFDAFSSELKDEDDRILVQEMVTGRRELVVGFTRDVQFGPCVMFGLGGIFTEILQDIVFRVAPLSERDAWGMMEDIRSKKMLESVRGMPAANKDQLANILINVGRIGLEEEKIKEIDINPVILNGSQPIAADALVVLDV